MRSEETGQSIGYHVPAAVTTSCHKHPLGAGHPSPGLDPPYCSSQASAADRSSSTMHCSQWGHPIPDTPSVSREVTGAPQRSLTPETRSPSTLDNEPHHHHHPLSPTAQPARCKACHRLVQALLACLPEHCRDIHTSAKTAWQEAGQESNGDGYSRSGGAGTSTQSSCLCVRQPLFCSTIVHQAQGAVVVRSRSIQHGCHLL